MRNTVIIYSIVLFITITAAQAVDRPQTLYGILEHIEEYFDNSLSQPCTLYDPYTINTLPFALGDNLYFKDQIEINSSHFYTATKDEFGNYGEISTDNNEVTIKGCRTCTKLTSSNNQELVDEIQYEINDAEYFEIGDVDFRAEEKISLKPGFTVEKGAYFHAYISPETKESYYENFEGYSGNVFGGNPVNPEDYEHDNLGDLGKQWIIGTPYSRTEKGLPRYHGALHEINSIPALMSAKGLSIENTGYLGSTNLVNFGYQGDYDLVLKVVKGTVDYQLDANNILQPIEGILYAKIRSKFQIYTGLEPYGRYDALAKSTDVVGLGNAIWLWARNGNAEANEIDILERILQECESYYNTGIILYNGHRGSEIPHIQSHMYKSIAKQPGVSKSYSVNSDYHLYSYEHYKDKQIFLFDNLVVARYPNNYTDRRLDTPTLMLNEPYIWILSISHHGGFDSENAGLPESALRVKFLKASEIIDFNQE